MSSSHQRASANTGRKAHASGARHTAEDVQERLMEDLKNTNTQLNKLASERDRYEHLYNQATKKLSDAHVEIEDLRLQAQTLKDDKAKLDGDKAALKRRNQTLKDDIAKLDEDKAALRRKYEEAKQVNHQLEHDNEELEHAYNHYYQCCATLKQSRDELEAELHAVASAPPATQLKLPERPKSSHKSPHKREHKEDRPRKSGKESREQRAEKERLSRRFDDKRPVVARGGFVEQAWSSGAVSPAPGRGFADVQAPAVPPSHGNVAFSSVPRTPNPLSPSLYKPSAGGLYKDGGYDDGNYHAYPVAR